MPPPPPPVYIIVHRAPPAVSVPSAPPAPKAEEPSPPPDPSYVWAPGFWYYSGGSYDWVGGQWLPPRAGYDLVPAAYSYVGGGWLFQPCYWRPHRRVSGYQRPGHAHGHHGRPHHVSGRPIGHPAAPAINPGAGGRVHRPAPAVTRKPAPTVVRVRKPAPGVAGVEQNARQAQSHRRTVVLRNSDGSVTIRPSSNGRVNPSKLRARKDYQGSRSGRMAFGNTSGRGYMLYGVRYRTDHTGAIVLGDNTGRVRVRGGGGYYHRAGRGRLTVVAANSRVHGVERKRARDPRYSATAQARRRRTLLRNPAWNPRRGGVTYSPRTARTRRALRSHFGRPRTYYARPRGRVYRPSYRRHYVPTRRAYRPTYRRYHAPQRVYRAPSHSYHRSSSHRSYRRSSGGSRSYHRASGVSRSRGGGGGRRHR